MKTLAIGIAAIAALIAADWQTSIARAQAQGGTNTRSRLLYARCPRLLRVRQPPRLLQAARSDRADQSKYL